MVESFTYNKSKGGIKMKTFTILRLSLLLGLSLIVGCAAPTSINLIYDPIDADTSPCKSSVAVVALEDQREFEAVGEDKKGQPISGTPAAAEWISRALLEELKKGGCRGEYHDKGSDFNTDYVVTGAVKEMYFTQKSMSGFDSPEKKNVTVIQSI
jgi:hypothetical protein